MVAVLSPEPSVLLPVEEGHKKKLKYKKNKTINIYKSVI